MFGGEYAVFVASAYGATVLILGGLIWTTIAASIRARRDLDEVERPGRKERPGG